MTENPIELERNLQQQAEAASITDEVMRLREVEVRAWRRVADADNKLLDARTALRVAEQRKAAAERELDIVRQNLPAPE